MVISQPSQHEHLGRAHRTSTVESYFAWLLTQFQDAEMASLTNNPDAFKLYDVAVK